MPFAHRGSLRTRIKRKKLFRRLGTEVRCQTETEHDFVREPQDVEDPSCQQITTTALQRAPEWSHCGQSWPKIWPASSQKRAGYMVPSAVLKPFPFSAPLSCWCLVLPERPRPFPFPRRAQEHLRNRGRSDSHCLGLKPGASTSTLNRSPEYRQKEYRLKPIRAVQSSS